MLRKVAVGLSVAAFVAAALCPLSAFAQGKSGEKPVGVITRSWGPPIPVYKSDLQKDLEGVKARVDNLAAEAKDLKLPEGKDEIEMKIPGAISLARHETEIAGIRDQFTKCVAIMMNNIQAKEDSGTATKEDKAQFEKCTKHCDQILAKLNSMHLNATRLSTATRRQYIVNGWDKHQKDIAELQKMMGECVPMMENTMACCEMAQHGSHKEDK